MIGESNGMTPRIGVMIPSANAIFEQDAVALAPAVSVHIARLPLTQDTKEQLLQLKDYVPAAATSLAHAGVDAIAFACTSGSLVGGLDYDQEIVRLITETTGLPATTTTTALVQSFRRLRLQRVVLLCPYPDWLADDLIQFFDGHSITVVGHHNWGIDLPRQLEAVAPADIVEAGIDLVGAVRDRGVDVDAVMIACTDFRGMAASRPLEERLGIPVISSNLATMWDAVRLAGVSTELDIFRSLGTSR